MLGERGKIRRPSGRQSDPGNLPADVDEPVLQGDVAGLRVGLAPLEVVEITAGGQRGGIVTGREPRLREMRLADSSGAPAPPILVGTQPGVIAFESTSGQRRATAKASMTSCNLLSA